MNDQLSGLPQTGGSLATPSANKTAEAAGVATDADADLQARLDNLRRE